MHTTKLGLLGLGSMGLGVAQRLLDSGFDVTVYNRTKDKATPAVQAGARLADSVPDAVAETGIVLLSLADETAVEQVLFGAALSALRPGAIVVDCSTVSPQFSRSATARLAAAGHARVEACLVGNPLQARSGQLRVLTAGESSDVEAVRPV
ncbi:MAG: NAD(P)-dependent oxidoreductase, partial [Pseudonocardiaceae bacterium]